MSLILLRHISTALFYHLALISAQTRERIACARSRRRSTPREYLVQRCRREYATLTFHALSACDKLPFAVFPKLRSATVSLYSCICARIMEQRMRFDTVAQATGFYKTLIPRDHIQVCNVLVVAKEYNKSSSDSFEIDPLTVVLQGAPWLMIIEYLELRERNNRPNSHRYAQQEQKGICRQIGFMHSHRFIMNHNHRENEQQLSCVVSHSDLFSSIIRTSVNVRFDFGFFTHKDDSEFHIINTHSAFANAMITLSKLRSFEHLVGVDASYTCRLQTLAHINEDTIAMHYMCWALAHPALAHSSLNPAQHIKLINDFLQAQHKLYCARSVFCRFAESARFPGSSIVQYFTRQELMLSIVTEADGTQSIDTRILDLSKPHNSQLGKKLYLYCNHWNDHPLMRGFLTLPLQMALEFGMLDWNLCMVLDGHVVAPQHYCMLVGAKMHMHRLHQMIHNPETFELSLDEAQKQAQQQLLIKAQETMVAAFMPEPQHNGALGNQLTGEQTALQAVSWNKFVLSAPPCVQIYIRRIECGLPAKRLKHTERLRFSSLCASMGLPFEVLSKKIQQHAVTSYKEVHDVARASEIIALVKDYQFAYVQANKAKQIAKAPSCNTMNRNGACPIVSTDGRSKAECCCRILDAKISEYDGTPAVELFNPSWYFKKLNSAVSNQRRKLTEQNELINQQQLECARGQIRIEDDIEFDL